ncbi:MAG: hypothetical protein WBF81_06355 [Thermoplasmata archaeon]
MQRSVISPDGKRVELYRSLLDEWKVGMRGARLRIGVRFRDLAADRLQEMWRDDRKEAGRPRCPSTGGSRSPGGQSSSASPAVAVVALAAARPGRSRGFLLLGIGFLLRSVVAGALWVGSTISPTTGSWPISGAAGR